MITETRLDASIPRRRHGATISDELFRECSVSGPILQVALPSPLRRLFDYLAPANVPLEVLRPGLRVRVPFGNRQLVGLIADVSDSSEVPVTKLKHAIELLDRQLLSARSGRYLEQRPADIASPGRASAGPPGSDLATIARCLSGTPGGQPRRQTEARSPDASATSAWLVARPVESMGAGARHTRSA